MNKATTLTRSKGKKTDSMPERRRFTVDEYLRMCKARILRKEERVELIEGEILLMTPIGNRHMACVNRFTAWLVPALAGRAIVSVQNVVRLSPNTMPQPDLAVFRLRQDFYADAYPGPGDTLLLIEVSDTSLRYDRDRKLPLYAAAGIPEAWIANLRAGNVLVGRDPSPTGYQHVETVNRAGMVSPAAFPDVTMRVAELLG